MDATLQKLKDYLMAEETWLQFGIIFIKVLIILLLTTIVVRIGKQIIKKLFLVRQRSPLGYSERRQNTLEKLIAKYFS